MERFYLALTTLKNREALRLAEHLVSEKLATCANMVHRVESTCRWKGKIERARETMMLVTSPPRSRKGLPPFGCTTPLRRGRRFASRYRKLARLRILDASRFGPLFSTGAQRNDFCLTCARGLGHGLTGRFQSSPCPGRVARGSFGFRRLKVGSGCYISFEERSPKVFGSLSSPPFWMGSSRSQKDKKRPCLVALAAGLLFFQAE